MKKLFLYIFLVLMFCNTATAKDLNGIKLYCYSDKERGSALIESYTALVFIENNQVILSMMFIETYKGYAGKVEKYTPLVLKKTYNYEVDEDYITLLTENRKAPQEWFSKEEYNYNLDVFPNLSLFRGNLKLLGGQFIYYEINEVPTCKIVDYDPLEKFEKKMKEIEVTKKKKKKI